MGHKVLHVIKQLRFGGAERTLVQIVTGLPQAYEPIVCSFRDGPFAADVRDAGIPTHAFYAPDIRFSRRDALRRTSRLIEDVRPDLIHTHMLEANLIGGWAAHRKGIPCVSHVQGPAEWANSCLHTLACRVGYRFLWARGTAMLACSTGLAKQLKDIAGASATAVYNAVDLDQFAPRQAAPRLRPELRLAETDPVVGTVARPCYQKNPQCLMRAASLVTRDMPEVHFVIVGSGPLDRQLLQMRERLGLTGNVHLLGARGDVPRILPEFDLFALPSRYEGFGIVLAEAMACRLAVVATDVVGANEVVVEGETGYLVPSDDHEALAQRIVELLRDAKLRRRMGEAGRKRVEEHFSVPRMIENVTRIYDRILGNEVARRDR